MPPPGELRYLPDAQAELVEERQRIKSEQKAFKSFRSWVEDCWWRALGRFCHGYDSLGDAIEQGCHRFYRGFDRLRPRREFATNNLRHKSESFCRQISSINTTQTHKTVAASAHQTNPVALSNNSSQSIERVENAYRETVMSVEHYEEDYGETLATNMAEELGSSIAQAITARHTWSPTLKQAIISATSTAQSNRTDLLEELNQEYATVSKVETALVRHTDPIESVKCPLSDCSLDTLADIWQDLELYESTCERLCRERQTQIQARKKECKCRMKNPSVSICTQK
jgi:hypothetical protein